MNPESPNLPPAPTPALPDALEQKPARSADLPPNVTAAATLICLTLVCALLYWGRTVAIPVALATLLSFMLNPLAKRLQRLRVPRGVASVLTVLLFCTAATTLTWIIGGQLAKLSQELPTYRQSIVQRVAEVRRAFQGGALDKLQTTMDEVASDLGKSTEEKPSFTNPTQPVPVVISNSRALFDFEILGTLLPVLEPLSIAGLVVILSILMMIRWDDLRSRLLSFSGKRNLTVATRALEDSGRKITRYLVVQALYNGGVGLVVGLGLAAMGLPYAALWGLCAGLFRYIPYAGPLVSAALPILHSLVTSTGWTQVGMVVVFFIILEVISNNIIEPWLYGSQLGMSEIGVVVSAVIWTFLWGPVGLMLATPLTVCLVVLGEYLPALNFLPRLLGDKPVLLPQFRFYQRLLAHDELEVEIITKEHLKAHGLPAFINDVVIPALVIARKEERHHLIPAEEATAMSETILQLVARHQTIAPVDPTENTAWSGKAIFMVVPDSELAHAAALLLDRALVNAPCDLRILSARHLAGEVSELISAENPAACCLLSLDQGTPYRLKHLLNRLATAAPALRLTLSLLGRSPTEAKPSWAGSAAVLHSFAELRSAMSALGSHSANVAPEEPLAIAAAA